MAYIPGADNTAADALSRLPDGVFPGENNKLQDPHVNWSVNAILQLSTDSAVLEAIKYSYKEDYLWHLNSHYQVMPCPIIFKH
jgi:hypothetical protein